MRSILIAASVLVLSAASARSDDPVTGPSDMTVIQTLGTNLPTAISKLGQPSDLVPKRHEKVSDDVVILDYDTFLLAYRDQQIRGGFFLKSWKGPILGVKIGDSRDAVSKVLGAAEETFKNKEGVVTAYGWKLKKLGIEFFTNFDDDGNVRRAEFEPLE